MRATNHDGGNHRANGQGPALPVNPAAPPARRQAPPMNAADARLFRAIACANEADFVALMTAAIKSGARVDAIDDHGNTAIDIAIERNSARIVQALLAVGAPLPSVPPSGFDLVMRAAAQGNPEIVSLLIDAEDMLSDATDASGCAALHYAVLSGSARTVEALLQREADIYQPACCMRPEQMEAIFGPRHGLAGEDLSPLNVAVALHQPPVLELLLQYGAPICTGQNNALWVAITRRDPTMLAQLLAHGAKTGQLGVALNQTVLESSLTASPETYLLRQLLEYADAQSTDVLDLDAALLVALTRGHVDQAALLLAHGACPEPTAATSKPIWAAAFDHDDDTLLNLLIMYSDVPFAALLASQPDAPPRLLTDVCRFADVPMALAVHGIFPSTIQSSLPLLREIAASTEPMTPAQLSVIAALALVRNLPVRGAQQSAELAVGPSVGPSAAPSAFAPEIGAVSAIGAVGNQAPAHLIPAAELQRDRSAVRHTQSEALAESIATRLRQMSLVAADAMHSLRNALLASLSSEFFDQARQRTSTERTEFLIERSLCERHGLPDRLAQQIAQSWWEADEVGGVSVSDSSSTGVSGIDTLSRRMSLLLYCKLDSAPAEPDSLFDYCYQALMPELLAQRAPLLDLIHEPARFLRSLEQRQGWRPVNVPALSQSLVQATALPAPVCDAMANCWQQAVADAAQQQNAPDGEHSLSHRFQSLDRRFADHWQSWLEAQAAHAGEAQLPLTPKDILQAIDWCERQRANPPAAHAEPRKRKAGPEAHGAPPTKSPRSE